MKRADRQLWWNWLTDDERAVVVASDAARAEWQSLAKARRAAINRGVQRMLHAARTAAAESPLDHLPVAPAQQSAPSVTVPPQTKIADFIRRAKS